MSELELIYVADAMCSWCWGFEPTIRGLADHHPKLAIRIVVGGLRPGPAAQPLTDELRGVLGHHWDQVEARSGQPFDRRGLDRQDWLYDTETPAMAVVAMRAAAPEETLPFLSKLQKAFYAEAVDITDPEAYRDLVEGFPVDPNAFSESLRSGDYRESAWQDFATARSWGVSGFPTVIGRSGTDGTVLARGWMPPAPFDAVVHAWLAEERPGFVSGDACSLGGVC